MSLGTSINPECDYFMENDPTQQSYCAEGEVCLWFSWRTGSYYIENKIFFRSKSFIRQCLSPSIILGSPDQPLIHRPSCQPQAISDSSDISVTACLCTSDLCNSYKTSEEKKPRRWDWIAKVGPRSKSLSSISAIAATHHAMTGNSLGDQLFPNGNPNKQNYRATKGGYKLGS